MTCAAQRAHGAPVRRAQASSTRTRSSARSLLPTRTAASAVSRAARSAMVGCSAPWPSSVRRTRTSSASSGRSRNSEAMPRFQYAAALSARTPSGSDVSRVVAVASATARSSPRAAASQPRLVRQWEAMWSASRSWASRSPSAAEDSDCGQRPAALSSIAVWARAAASRARSLRRRRCGNRRRSASAIGLSIPQARARGVGGSNGSMAVRARAAASPRSGVSAGCRVGRHVVAPPGKRAG